jgi:hypothetical protein
MDAPKIRKAVLAVLVFWGAFGTAFAGQILYVDADANGSNDGSSWADAFNYLQDAIDAGAGYGSEVWVAQGTYKPTNRRYSGEPRSVAFNLQDGVMIYGGFNGTETSRMQRDPEMCETILSGDLDNDGLDADNAWHVVEADTEAVGPTGGIDGFTVTGGFADGQSPENNGGGIYINHESPTIANCRIVDNYAAVDGGGIYSHQSDPNIINCTFIMNVAEEFGGGMYNEDSNATVTGCTFTRNHSEGWGGGISNWNSSPMITNCALIANSAGIAGGGMACNSGSGTIVHCTIRDNNSIGDGGGIMCNASTEATFLGCTISNNSSGGDGGGMLCAGNSTVINCTISGNSSDVKGGGIFCAATGVLTMANSILWGNSAMFGPQVYVFGGSVAITYSDVEGDYAGVGNIDAEPQFVSPGGGDYHLGPNSPCIDAGDNNSVPPSLVADLDGEERIINGTVDMGADEVAMFELTVIAGDHGTAEPNSGSYFAGTVVTLTATPDEHYRVGQWTGTDDDTSCSFTNTVTMDSDIMVTVEFQGRRTLFVPGEYMDLQSAIDGACDGDIVILNKGLWPWDIHFNGKNVIVTSACPDDPVVVAHTVLLGSGTGPVVTFSGCEDESCVLLGLTITGGNTPGDGGGICGNGTEATISNCVITGNHADVYGGGINDCNGAILSCTISDNSARYGGGMYCRGGPRLITRCEISDNNATWGGGGLCLYGLQSLEMISCLVRNNRAGEYGGGIDCSQVQGLITDCEISDNNATTSGGGLYLMGWPGGGGGAGPQVRQCLITNNTAGRDGGGISCSWYAEPTITNCTIADNTVTDGYGGGLYCAYESDANVMNSILWGNTALHGAQVAIGAGDSAFPLPSAVAVLYSDAEGGQAAVHIDPGCTLNWGTGSIASNPMFIDANVGDYHPGAGSPCIDAGDSNSVPPSLLKDLDGNARIINGVVDMGPYENTYYYVDGVNGDDNNDGRSPETAFATIQKGIDTAEDGCVVLVFPAEYLEPDPWDPQSINFLGKNIKVTSAEPGDWDIVESTVIRGIVLFDGSEDANCVLTGFTVRDISNGAIYGNHTHATISHCIISGNGPCSATVIENCDGIISNCLITDNLTIYYCGVYPVVMGCHGVIKNCTIANNASGIGILDGGETTIENCIIHGNGDPNIFEPQILVGAGGTLNISYSNLQGGLPGISSDGTVNWGIGNIEADPCFVRLGAWDYGPWPWELAEGDYHLKSEGWRLSEYGPWWVYDDVTSRSIDWGNPGCPLGEELMSIPRDPDNMYGVNVRINMGAYGGTAEASMAPHGWVLLSDLDNDGATTLADLGWQAEDWLRCESDLPGDLNRDGLVNMKDYAILAAAWEVEEDMMPPTPNPMRWDYTVMDVNGYLIDGTPHEIWLGPDPIWDYHVTMRADPNTYDESGFEFYFECTNQAGFDSGWISFPEGPPYTYMRYIGLSGQTLYFRVKARDLSPNHNETAWSEELPMYIEW